MIEYLYEMWHILLGLSSFMSIISGIISFKKVIRTTQLQRFVNILFGISIAVVIASYIIGTTFTKVPRLIGYTVHVAEDELKEANLEIALQSGLAIDYDTRNAIITGQSHDEGEFVLQNTVISVYLEPRKANSDFVTVPNVINKRYLDATSILEGCRLAYRIRAIGQSSIHIENAYVVSQSIAAGASVPIGSLIDLELSSAETTPPSSAEYSASTHPSQTVYEPSIEIVIVPNVIAMAENEAVWTLECNNLQAQVYWVDGTNESSDDYYIISQSIPEGSWVPAGTLVEIERSDSKPVNCSSSPVVSTEMVFVPDVQGMEEHEAVQSLEACGLQAQICWLTGMNESLEFYYVVNQSIPAGSRVPIGSIVEIERSSRKPGTPVVVPDVIGKEQHEATRLLINHGLQFQVWWTEESDVESDYIYVVEQSVSAGTTVPAGALIRLRLSVAPP